MLQFRWFQVESPQLPSQPCYLPVHVAMICFLYEHGRGDIPSTETKICEHFTRFIVLHKQRRNEEAHLGSLEDLRGEGREYFSSIYHLFFEMTIHSTTEVPLSVGTGPDDAPSLGLVTIDRISSLGGLDKTLCFPSSHLPGISSLGVLDKTLCFPSSHLPGISSSFLLG